MSRAAYGYGERHAKRPGARALLLSAALVVVLAAGLVGGCSPMPLMAVAIGGAGAAPADQAVAGPSEHVAEGLPAEDGARYVLAAAPSSTAGAKPEPAATPTALPSPTLEPSPTATEVPPPTAAPTVEPPPPTAAPTEPAPADPPPPADAPPDRIVAPRIGLDARVVVMSYEVTYINGAAVTSWRVPRDDAAFHEGSAYPGRPGNTVVSGHNNVGAQVFRALGDLQLGDVVTLYVGQTGYRYTVSQREVVREAGASYEERVANARWILPTDDERLTLVTCYPYPASTHRLIIVARPLR